MKKVIVFSTVGATGKEIQTEALNWGELQKQLDREGVKYEGMKAVDGATKVTFEANDASLPEGDLNLFLFPVKTKSGGIDATNMSYGEIRATIKAAFEADKDGANAHFNVDKNYTNKSTDQMRQLLATYNGPLTGTATPATKAPSKAVGKGVSKVVESVKEAKTASTPAPAKGVRSVAAAVASETTKSSSVPARKQETGVATNLDSRIDVLVDAVNALKEVKGIKAVDVDNAVKALLRLKIRVEDGIDNEELSRQAREIAKSFKDIKGF